MFVNGIFLASIITFAVHVVLTRANGLGALRVIELALLHLLAVFWGLGGLAVAIPHIISPDVAANYLQWPTGNPFQLYAGFAMIGIAVVGVLSIWHRGWFWLAPLAMRAVFLTGAAYIHISGGIYAHRLTREFATQVLFYDIFLPLIAIVLFAAYVALGGARNGKDSAVQASVER